MFSRNLGSISFCFRGSQEASKCLLENWAAFRFVLQALKRPPNVFIENWAAFRFVLVASTGISMEFHRNA